MKRIKEISVTRLFGIFNYAIPLNIQDRITIIHGPNGSGKTIMLRLLSELFSDKPLEELFSRNNSVLGTAPFEEFRVNFEDDSSLKVNKSLATNNPDSPVLEDRISFSVEIPYDKPQKCLMPLQTSTSMYLKSLRGSLATNFERRLREAQEIYLDEDYKQPRFKDAYVFEEPAWLSEIRRSVPVHLIEAQRLLSLNEQQPATPAVQTYADELARTITAKLAESTALSQSLDRTFPVRVVNLTAQQVSMSEDELHRKLDELEKRRARLTAAGLLDQDDNTFVQVRGPLDERTKAMLFVYVEDTEKKLGIFDEIADKIELLTTLINDRFLYKHLSISKEAGFVFTTEDGTRLSPTALSSGEQHGLALFYELLFKVAPGSLILIDEPELSLHVVWQDQFLKDLPETIRLADFDALIATHSPDIIGGRLDLMIELKGPLNE